MQAIETATNQCVATIPVGQLPQALVYVPNAVTSDKGMANLMPLGLAGGGVLARLFSGEPLKK